MRCYSITSSARFEISVDGMPRLHRDRKEIAIQAAARLMIKYPHSLVAVKDLKSGKPGSGRPEAAIAPMLTMRPTGLASPAFADWGDWTVLDDGRIVRRIL